MKARLFVSLICFVCLFLSCDLWFVCLFDSKLVVCWFYSSINQWNEINQTNQLSFLLHTLFSINQCQSSVNFFFHSFFPSLISIQSNPINQSKEINWQTRQKKRNRWMNEWMNWNQSHWQVNSCAIDHRESIRSCLIVYFLFQSTN